MFSAGVRTIPLTKGYEAIVDAEDYEQLSHWSWHTLGGNGKNLYAIRTVYVPDTRKQINVLMHRQVLGIPVGSAYQTDHINGNGLDNRKSNLRSVTPGQNSMNQRVYKNNNSGYAGVGFDKAKNAWRARIRVSGQLKHLGYYEHREDAAAARRKAEEQYFGEYGRQSEPRRESV